MSSTQYKREAFDYREEFFKKNPGIFSCIWFCGYCGKILFGRSQVEVDHIVPLKSAFGANRTFNTVAACKKCNRSKGAKVGMITVRGMFGKVLTEILIIAQKLLIYALVAIIKVIQGSFALAMLPVKKSKNPFIKIAFISAYILSVYWFLKYMRFIR